MKTCSNCHIEKQPSDFRQRSKSIDGLQYICKSCAHQCRTTFRGDNREAVRAKEAEYYKANAERIKSSRRQRYAVNPASGHVSWQKRRALKLNAVGVLSPGLAGRLYKLQGGKCPCCKQPLGDDYHMDHIMPLSLGGTNTDDNIQLLRKKCNQTKRARQPIEFMQSRGFLL